MTKPSRYLLLAMSVAFAIWRVRGHFTVPVRDPFLKDSLAYKQP